MRNTFLILLLPAVLLAGCATKFLDARGDSEVCERHHITMQSIEVQPPRNATQPARDYLEARVRYFIHSYPTSLPYQPRTKYVVYICENCVLAERNWLQLNPQNQR